MHKDLFGAEETLTEIVKNIAIPNVKLRAADEETFEVCSLRVYIPFGHNGNYEPSDSSVDPLPNHC